VSTPTYFVQKTNKSSWGNHPQGKIGNRAPGVNPDLFEIKNKRNFLGKSSPGTNRHPVPQVSTSTYFESKTSETSWGNHLQGQIVTLCPRCQPRPILNKKKAKLSGEIIPRYQLAPRAPGVNLDLFSIKNKRNFLGKSSPATNRHHVPQVSTPTYFVQKTNKKSWGNHLQGQISTPCPRCQPRPILNQ